MKLLRPSASPRLLALLAALPAIASAHPGHDGGHDLTWDFGSLGHVHYGPMLVGGLLLVGAVVVIAKLATRGAK
jgi:hypothetical protein